MVENNNLKVKLNSFNICRIGAIIKILEKLVDLNRIKNDIEAKHNFNDFSKYIKSYEFCVCFCLHQILEILAEDQEFLEFKEDQLFVRAFYSVFDRSKFPTDTELCVFANNIFGLIDKIFKKKDYAELREFLPNVIKYILNPFKEIIYNNFELTESYRYFKKDEIFSRLARSYFHIVFHDGQKVRKGYEHIVKKGEPIRKRLKWMESLQENPKMEIKSPVSEIDPEKGIFDPFNNPNVDRVGGIQETLGEQLFFEGYKLIIDYLWDKLFKNPFSKYEFLKKVVLSKDWAEFDNYFEKIRDEIILPLENMKEAIDISFQEIFVKQNRIQNETLNLLKKETLFFVRREELTEREKLDRSFLWYPVKLVDSKSSVYCGYQFRLILMGLIYLNEDIIKIIQFFHPNRPGYSYAIQVRGPTYNLLLDYTSWYVFLDFAAERYGTAGAVKRSIDDLLHQFNSKIQLHEHKVDSEDLKNYLKDKEITDLSNKIGELEEYKADVKGLNLELFTAYIFSKLGYQVYWSFKEKCTNETEIDLLAFRKYKRIIKFYIVEITTTEESLFEEVQKKIEILKKNSSILLKSLNLDEHLILKFRGLAISDIKTDLRVDKNVRIINLKEILENLKNVRIELRRKLLKIIET